MNAVVLSTRTAAFFFRGARGVARGHGAGMVRCWYMPQCPASGDCTASAWKKANAWSTTSED